MTTHTIDVYVTVTHKYIATVDSEQTLAEVQDAIRGMNAKTRVKSDPFYIAAAIDFVIDDNFGNMTHVHEYDTEVEDVYIEGDKQ